MLLYSFKITPNNRKVESFIAHYDLPVEVRQVNFKAKETQSPEFFALNPMRKVPVLVDGDFSLFESNAILTYLARQFPETHALPEDARGRADADRWLHWQSCHLMPLMGALKTGAETDLAAVNPLLDVLEQRLAGRDYLLGELSVADFAVAAYLMTKLGSQIDYSGHPDVAAWRERMLQSKGFRATEMRKPPSA
ncbi:MAG: glutathione S-transferase family protein [Gammaproteobacteria bacterium]|jgi:glutathione S-transferase|nr:glutathione S-transferase family protein [Gammaproteobacteria bacterium]